ncbi:hemerythrin domain-containing protein [Mycolicibacterium thermoresistibile]
MTMAETLSTLLEREHRQIDAGIEEFIHGPPHAESSAHDAMRALDTLRRHIYLEEEFLFPPLRDSGFIPPVLVMLREHGEIWRLMDAVQALLCAGDRDGARNRCIELLAHLATHNGKEEPIIYPRGDAVLPPETNTELRRFIDSGVLPPGWVCAHA